MKQNNFYWSLFAPMIKCSIKKRFGTGLADQAIHKGKAEYPTLVADAPELGRDNPMASNAYFAYVFVGAWLGTEKKLTPEDMGLVMTDVLKKFRFFFSVTDMNKSPDKWYCDMKKYEKWYDAGNGKR